MRPERSIVSELIRLRAVSRALELLHLAARRESTFVEYSGHLLLSFFLIGTTSRNAAIARRSLEMGRERARHWQRRWVRTRRSLDRDNVLQEVLASYAADQMGVEHELIRRELLHVVAKCSVRELIYFDPGLEGVPDDVLEDCPCGRVNERGHGTCGRDRKSVV